MLKDLTPATQAAIYYHVVGGCNDFHVLFKIAEGEKRYNELKGNGKAVTVSKWKLSNVISDAIQELKYKIEIEDRKKIDLYLQERETEGRQREPEQTNLEGINFLDPDQFLQFANQQANTITDEKERRAYLEMIAKLMNYKDKDSEEQEQIKAYLPVNCENCELYKRCKACNLDRCPI